jgi:ABC-2 type transport system ATP-binding protein
VAGWLQDSAIDVDDIGLSRPSLDDVFLSLTGRRAEADEAEERGA